mmetsp:Transcript_118634/g.369592  ORF Transcript_118634/g.369592 Transcript_118634/m.369592 type:complete len:224 (-) Transcript_118634:542-1213(-)
MHLAAGPTQALHPGLHRPHLRDDARIRERAAARTPPRQPGRGRAESGCRCPRCRCLLGDGLRDQRAAGPDARARRRRVPRGAAGRRLRHVCAAQRTRGQRRLRPGLPRPRGAQRRPLPGPGTLHSCGLPHRAALRLHAAFLAGARSGTARREAAGRRAPRHLRGVPLAGTRAGRHLQVATCLAAAGLRRTVSLQHGQERGHDLRDGLVWGGRLRGGSTGAAGL